MNAAEAVVAQLLGTIPQGAAGLAGAWEAHSLAAAELVTPSFGRTAGAAVPGTLRRAWDSPGAGPAAATLDDLVSTQGTVFAEYTLRYADGSAGRRHAVVALTDGEIESWHDHGDVPARTTAEPSDPVVGGTRGPAPRVHSGRVNETAAEAVREFFRLHEQYGFEGVLMAWRKFAHPEVVLWHSAEGVRGRGIDEVVAFYSGQHEKYPYAGFKGAPETMAAIGSYVAGEITYLLDGPQSGDVITLPASFALDVDEDGRFTSWRDYSRFWIPAPGA